MPRLCGRDKPSRSDRHGHQQILRSRKHQWEFAASMVPKPVRKVILARYQPRGPSHTSEYRVSQWKSSRKRGFRPVCPQALLKALDEDELDPEERYGAARRMQGSFCK